MAVPASPALDAIVPVHNQRELVESCLTSVLSARNRVAFEVVVIDDASTDPELKAHLAQFAEAGLVTLLTNPENRGFTRSVNRGMQLHPERDVVLLNSDTLVSSDWIDRLQLAAFSEPMVGTANPLTNASHIGPYPFRIPVGDVAFEISDEELDGLAAEANRGRYVAVHLTVGFCMYIRRAVLDAVGYFDYQLFPIGYGEDSDFCYRARKLGWCHIVTGDVFVRPMERKRGRAYGQDLRERLFLAADAGTSVGAVSKMLMVSVSYVSKVVGRRRRSGETTARPQRCHVPPKLAEYHAALCARVSTCPDATLAELQAWLQETHKVAANTTLDWETLKTLRLTLKKRRYTPRSRAALTLRCPGAQDVVRGASLAEPFNGAVCTTCCYARIPRDINVLYRPQLGSFPR